VGAIDPDFGAVDVSLKDAVYLVSSADGSGQTYFVDAGSGAVNGHNNLYGGVVGFLENLHDCALTCEEYAGFTPWLASPSPFAELAPFSEMTWGAVLLAIAALAVVFLADGHAVNPYWRALWFVLGLAPLLLLLTGLSTWLYRRQVTRRRRAAQVTAD
jgi:uncharacterized iron-regulated membrane protein